MADLGVEGVVVVLQLSWILQQVTHRQSEHLTARHASSQARCTVVVQEDAPSAWSR